MKIDSKNPLVNLQIKQKNNMLKYIYFGTPEISRKVMEDLANSYQKPLAIVTSVDAKSGRGLQLKPSFVSIFGTQNNIPVLKPNKLKDIENELRSYNADVGILFAYGKIIPAWLLEMFPHGIINVHPSLLPLYRGASPLTGPILNNENNTGVSIMDMDIELDHGDIYLQNKMDLNEKTNRLDIEDFTIKTAPDLLIQVLNDLEKDQIKRIPQNHSLATYTTKIKKEDGAILETDTNETKYKKYKAYLVWPGIYYIDQTGKRIKITKADFIDGKFIIEKIIPEGGKEIDF
jgi:methionyl-tRNA formyltransferase